MRRRHGNRSRIGGALLLAAIGAIALLALPGAAAAKDRNHDRIPDRWEKRHHLSLKVDQAKHDQDRDGLRNRAEFLAGDNPRDRDSDDDGVMDGEENAGTIASFDKETGRLVINLFGGDTVSGIVDGNTRIECENETEHTGATASHDGEDNSGPGSGGDDDSAPTAGDEQDHPEPGAGDQEDNSGPGNAGDQNDNDDQGEDQANCTAEALVAGAVVKEAELDLENGAATFEEVELAG